MTAGGETTWWRLVPKETGSEWVYEVERRRKPVADQRVCSCGLCVIGDVLAAAPKADPGLYVVVADGMARRFEVDVAGALEGLLAEWDKLTKYGSPLAKHANPRVALARRVLRDLTGGER